MTWDEKLAQMQVVFRPDPAELERWVRAGVGAIFWPRSAAAVNAFQRVAVEQTRLGIPLLVGLDVIHGQRTIAPTPLAMAASFDPDVVERTARLAAAEAASGGVNWTFSPMIDVSRDPRWGRAVESFGEDPYLTAVMGAAMIRGYQGDDLRERSSIAATAKHFVGYGDAEGGRDYNTADMSEHLLRNVYLEPFRAATAAGVAAVMAAFNTIGGKPMHAHRRLLTGVLKDEWGMRGVIVGDADGVGNLVPHGVAADLLDALRQSVRAGLDIEMGGSLTDDGGHARLTPEQLPADRVDDAVRRILTLKARLGLFDQPYVREAEEITGPTGQARAQVRAAAVRSTVLLKNDGTLPVTLDGQDPADRTVRHLHRPPRRLDAEFRRPGRLDRRGAGQPVPARGIHHRAGRRLLRRRSGRPSGGGGGRRDHDLVLVFAGEPSHLSGEAASRSDLRLPGRQEELIRAVAATGIPFAVVLINGRPAGHLRLDRRRPCRAGGVAPRHRGAGRHRGRPDRCRRTRRPAPDVVPAQHRAGPGLLRTREHRASRDRGGTMRQEAVDIGLAGPDNVAEKYTSKYLDLDLGPQFDFGHGGGYTTFRHANARLSAARLSRAALENGEQVELSV